MDLTYFEKIALWRECDVNNLAANFHRIKKGGLQYERLGALHLSTREIQDCFPAHPIESIDIDFALERSEVNKNQFTFRPVITVRHLKENKIVVVERQFSFPDEIKPQVKKVAKVPHEFKDAINQNWDQLDISLMDDIFAASLPHKQEQIGSFPNEAPKIVPQRLLGYHFRNGKEEKDQINADFLIFLNKYPGRIDQFIFYLGMDMNKRDHKDKFTFSPIIEVFLNPPIPGSKPIGKKEDRANLLENAHHHGLRTCAIKGADDEDLSPVYVEYMSPCPASC